jgi:hypothetical protein
MTSFRLAICPTACGGHGFCLGVLPGNVEVPIVRHLAARQATDAGSRNRFVRPAPHDTAGLTREILAIGHKQTTRLFMSLHYLSPSLSHRLKGRSRESECVPGRAGEARGTTHSRLQTLIYNFPLGKQRSHRAHHPPFYWQRLAAATGDPPSPTVCRRR